MKKNKIYFVLGSTLLIAFLCPAAPTQRSVQVDRIDPGNVAHKLAEAIRQATLPNAAPSGE